MLFARDWLGSYVELPEDAAQVARRLTFAGFAVASIAPVAGSDAVFDVEVTSNRPDCMCHLGLARELAVLFDRPLRQPEVRPREGAVPVGQAVRVDVEDAAGCPRFAARVVRGVRVGPSPAWLRARLEAIGLRAINNVVDVTNFVLWEMGQPLHAYDLARLAGGRIVVRRGRGGEALTTLDGVERRLDPEILVIADGERPIGLAGVMGGRDSEVAESTSDVLIEAAHFDRRRVRLAARRFALHTDASHRFERGADPEACRAATDRAAALIAEVAGGEVLAGAIDRRAAPGLPLLRGRLELARLNSFAGAAVPAADVERWLAGLGFGISPVGPAADADGPAWEVTVPSWRFYDFTPRPGGGLYPADFYEEVLRIYGLDRIAAALPALPGSDGPQTAAQLVRDRVRRCLAGAGFSEAINFSFADPAADAALPNLRPGTPPLLLANPLSERAAALRRSLVPNLVDSARFNQRRGVPAVRLFEVATVFFDRPGAPLPDEPEHVALVCGGRLGSPWSRELDLDLFDLKGAVEGLAEALGVRLAARPATLPGLLAGAAAELLDLDSGEVAGYMGRLEAEEVYPLFAAEIALAALTPRIGPGAHLAVETPSRFPAVSADFTLTQPLDVPWSEIEAAIAAASPPDLVSFALKDRYRGPGVPEGAVNTTIAFLYNARDRSLSQDEVNERQAALTQELERRFGWKGAPAP
ncbi:MAG TPA: phenylalanine--tRNA ligase subunit beta [Thermoanaerobaculia bacterium]|nr:phenylalanine--tRNA ligase subunit beta [Thermoanaerobaculia bacterium]